MLERKIGKKRNEGKRQTIVRPSREALRSILCERSELSADDVSTYKFKCVNNKRVIIYKRRKVG
jgi:hypothetical protein